MAINKVKGTYDVLPSEVKHWHRLESAIRNVTALYHYQEIRTPIFEYYEVFHRDQADSSDMVNKETYDFKDRGDRQLTLRPEGTAGIIRSYVENKLYADTGVTKVYYMGPNFRYERPQKGRFRQFYQYGVEALGSEDPALDAEVIALAATTLRALGLNGVKVRINSLGDDDSRASYKKALIDHFTPHKEALCHDCQTRLAKNPLRVLDCKVDQGHESFIKAPLTLDYLNEPSKAHFDKVLTYLKAMQIEYEIAPRLVRGLDYYTHTVFEVEANIEGFGAQNVLAGGGRYNKLVEALGGPQTPGIGFAFGMERLLLALEAENKLSQKGDEIHLFIIGLGDVKEEVMRLTQEMRLGGLITECDYLNKNLKGQFKLTEKYQAKYIAILGEDELASGTINIKDTQTQEQVSISRKELYKYIIHSIEHKRTHKEHCGNCQH